MIQIDNTLVSLDVLECQFLCGLSHCKGACCVEGDSGAPLQKKEIAELEKALPVIWDDLSPKAQEIIKKQGVAYMDEEGDIVTSIVNGKDCVFTCYDTDGTCKCAVEKAYREGKLSFYKPVSCHLYPIRVTEYDKFSAVNYNRWNICKAAEVLGKKEKLPVYKFLKEPLIRRFGQKWYAALEEVAAEWEKQKEGRGGVPEVSYCVRLIVRISEKEIGHSIAFIRVSNAIRRLRGTRVKPEYRSLTVSASSIFLL